MTCQNCNTDHARRKGLCDACYQHHWRTGSQRPERNIIRLNTKRHEDDTVTRRTSRRGP